jgi:hypothetical protein
MPSLPRSAAKLFVEDQAAIILESDPALLHRPYAEREKMAIRRWMRWLERPESWPTQVICEQHSISPGPDFFSPFPLLTLSWSSSSVLALHEMGRGGARSICKRIRREGAKKTSAMH